MQSTVKFIKQYGKKWGISLEGREGLIYSFDGGCANIQQGDTIVYELKTSKSESTGKEYTNLVLTGEVPERDVNGDMPKKKSGNYGATVGCAGHMASRLVASGKVDYSDIRKTIKDLTSMMINIDEEIAEEMEQIKGFGG